MKTIEQALDGMSLGEPEAVKRGRRSEWPYVPVLRFHDHGNHQTTQIKGFAFATREEALEHARKHIAFLRQHYAERFRDPRYRALRMQHGLPQEAADLPA